MPLNMNNPERNKHFNILIWVGEGGLKMSTFHTDVDNCERPDTLGAI